MIILVLGLLGLCLGSFINAWVWRMRQQLTAKSKAQKQRYSLARGRSMCVHCKHVLAAKDLIPVVSWVMLRGRCRYCKKKISAQYPAVELLTAVAFMASYLFWPASLEGTELILFGLWLAQLVPLIALAVYDYKWFLLPNRMLIVLAVPVVAQFALQILRSLEISIIISTVLGVLVGGGFFWLIFQLSRGTWIGGGDVKLGFLLGAILGSPALSFLMIFLASVAGTTYSLPLLLKGRSGKNTRLSFGPLLILSTVITKLAGIYLINLYKHYAGL